jgi:cob(I)alamin adenosyltransferase
MAIDKYTQISTKNGDKGTSKNYSNEAFSKSDLLFETLGTIDELSSTLGLTFHHTHYEKIKNIQTTLQAINALIATNKALHPERYSALRQINDKDITFIEDEEATFLEGKPIDPRFYLPGSETTLKGAYFDISRAITRRAERTLIRYIDTTKRDDLTYVKQYLNRLSDLFFILARNFD